MAYAAYLLDIEGTTTPIDFVTRTLFPYAREHLGAVIVTPEEAQILSAEYEQEVAPPDWPGRPEPGGVVPYLAWLMDQDRKSTGLKSVQGRIWEEGYRSGELQGEIYPEVELAMRRWRATGANIHIFSSGSVLAQRLLFQNLPEGDLTPLITSYFDTTTGPKRVPQSYTQIAHKVGVEPGYVLFLSDVIEEVDAARAAGLAAILVDRSQIPLSHSGGGGLGRGSGSQPHTITTFDEVP